MQTNTRVGFAALVVAGLTASGCGSSSESAPRPPVTTKATQPTRPTQAAVKGKLPKPYQPLWPSAAAETWNQSPDQTALRFTQRFLGFSEIDRVVGRKVAGADARITVGYRSPETGRDATVAVIHLLRAGDGSWTVVGTDDPPEFTLTTPAYGAAVSSPVKVGGRITGVDESIRVQVRQPSSAKPLGEHCCLSAGGERSPWSVSLTFRGATDPVLTIVAWTGGHIAEVERFAITGVRR